MYVGIWAIVIICLAIPSLYTFLCYGPLGREQILLLLVEILATPFVLYAWMRIFQQVKVPLHAKTSANTDRKKKKN